MHLKVTSGLGPTLSPRSTGKFAKTSEGFSETAQILLCTLKCASIHHNTHRALYHFTVHLKSDAVTFVMIAQIAASEHVSSSFYFKSIDSTLHNGLQVSDQPRE